MFLQGQSPFQIARTLTEEGIPSPGGKDHWNPSNIKSILTNEKYKGDALLQKSFTVDFLTKKKKANEKVQTFTQFAAQMNRLAKEQKRTQAKSVDTTNEKYILQKTWSTGTEASV